MSVWGLLFLSLAFICSYFWLLFVYISALDSVFFFLSLDSVIFDLDSVFCWIRGCFILFLGTYCSAVCIFIAIVHSKYIEHWVWDHFSFDPSCLIVLGIFDSC